MRFSDLILFRWYFFLLLSSSSSSRQSWYFIYLLCCRSMMMMLLVGFEVCCFFVANLHNFVFTISLSLTSRRVGLHFQIRYKKNISCGISFLSSRSLLASLSIYFLHCFCMFYLNRVENRRFEALSTLHLLELKKKHVWSARWFEAQWNYPSPRWCAVSFERDSDFFVFSVDSFFLSSAVCFFPPLLDISRASTGALAHTAEMLSLGWWIYGGNFVCASARGQHSPIIEHFSSLFRVPVLRVRWKSLGPERMLFFSFHHVLTRTNTQKSRKKKAEC